MWSFEGGEDAVAGGIFLEGPNPSALSLAARPGEVLRMAEGVVDCDGERFGLDRDDGVVSDWEELTEEADEDGLIWA